MADDVDVADIDAELQGGRGDHHRILAGLEFLFDFQARLARQAAMMRADFVFAQPLGQLVRNALDQTARVDEYQCRPVRLNLLDQFVVDRRPNILANDRAKL